MTNTQRRTRNLKPSGSGSVQLHIERLVLDGLPLGTADAVRLQASVERELSRLFSVAPARDWTGGSTNHLPTDPVHLAPGGSPAVWGRQIARSLFSTVAPTPGPGSTVKATAPLADAQNSHGHARAITT